MSILSRCSGVCAALVGATLALAELALGTVGNYGVAGERAVPEKLGTVPSTK